MEGYCEEVGKNIGLGLERFDYDNYLKGVMKKGIFINGERFKKFLLGEVKLEGRKEG